jgi:hypothetical protein
VTHLRTPDIMLLGTLAPILFAFWGSWQAHPYRLRTPGEALTFALFLSVPALLIALGAAFTRWRTRNAPLPPPVFVVLLVLLLGNSAWMPGVFMSMG